MDEIKIRRRKLFQAHINMKRKRRELGKYFEKLDSKKRLSALGKFLLRSL